MKYLKTAIIVIGALCTAYLIRTVGRKTDADIVTERNQAVLDARRPLEDSLGRMALRVDSFVLKASRAQGVASRATQQVVVLRQALIEARTPQDTVRALDSLVLGQGRLLAITQQRCEFLDSARVGCAERAALLSVRVDTLESALRRQISVSTCRVLFVKCVSRFQAAAIGIILGAVAGFELHP